MTKMANMVPGAVTRSSDLTCVQAGCRKSAAPINFTLGLCLELFSMIIGKTKLERKKCLASIVAKHLVSLGHTASVVEGRINSKGHTDRVLVESSIGLVHLTASVNQEPDGSIPTSDHADDSQAFLADKDFVVYGWNTKDKRTMIMFVPIVSVIGNKSMSKSQIKSANNCEYSTVLRQST